MERSIHHTHVRTFVALFPEVVAAVDALWGGGSLDAVPRALHGWKRSPHGGQGFVVGTRFGHGPFCFYVEQWDGHTLRARIETAGFRGCHGFELESKADSVTVTHQLDAQLTLPNYLLWQLLIARSHDWAVEAVFDRMHALLRDGQQARVSSAPPLRLRAFAEARRLLLRMRGHREHSARASS